MVEITHPRIIENTDAIQSLRSTYPDSRATIEDTRRASTRQVDYALFGVDEPIILENNDYEDIVGRKMQAYLRVCEAIATKYRTSSTLRRHFYKALLQHESEPIRKLVDEYPLMTLAGAHFASDVMFGEYAEDTEEDVKKEYKTVEVNFGPVGGISEGARGQKFFPNENFPLSSETLSIQAFHSANSYYELACAQLGIEPKHLNTRTVVYVENDGWYPGSIDLVNSLRELGMNIQIVPREALVYDRSSNKLQLTTNGLLKPVDQVILDYHLNQENTDSQTGDITDAIANRAVVAETTIFTQIVLGSKVTMALIDHMVRNPSYHLVEQLGIDTADLQLLEGMFPTTDQWSKAFFDCNRVNGLNLRKFLKDSGLIAKLTSGGLYGGRGVYMLNEGDSKVIQDFTKGIREEVMKTLLDYGEKAGNRALRRFLRSATGRVTQGENGQKRYTDLVGFLDIRNTRNETRVTHLLTTLYSPNLVGGTSSKLRIFLGLTEDEEKLFIELHDMLHNGEYNTSTAIEKVLGDIAYFVRRSVGDKKVTPNIQLDLQRRMIESMSTGIYLPVVLQRAIKPTFMRSGRQVEFRVAGTVGKSVGNNSAFLAGYRRGAANEPPKLLHPVVIRDRIPPYKNIADDPASAVLEIEEEAPENSTALDLSALPSDRVFDLVVDPMCGVGRHGRLLISQGRARRFKGYDLSSFTIDTAIQRSRVHPNIEFSVKDTREALDNLTENPDAIIIPGNSLIYFDPETQKNILQRIYAVLKPRGILAFDVVDVPKYQEQVHRGNPVAVRTALSTEQAYQRFVLRQLEQDSANPGFTILRELTTYITDQMETTHEQSSFYLPSEREVIQTLTSSGFSNIDTIRVNDDYYAGMMRHRILLKAEKL